jgi:hypothetical protein
MSRRESFIEIRGQMKINKRKDVEKMITKFPNFALLPNRFIFDENLCLNRGYFTN